VKAAGVAAGDVAVSRSGFGPEGAARARAVLVDGAADSVADCVLCPTCKRRAEAPQRMQALPLRFILTFLRSSAALPLHGGGHRPHGCAAAIQAAIAQTVLQGTRRSWFAENAAWLRMP